MLRYLNLILYIISIAGMLFSLYMIIEGLQPCSGDGCLVRILFLFGMVTLLISAVIFYFTQRNINRLKRKQEQ